MNKLAGMKFLFLEKRIIGSVRERELCVDHFCCQAGPASADRVIGQIRWCMNIIEPTTQNVNFVSVSFSVSFCFMDGTKSLYTG